MSIARDVHDLDQTSFPESFKREAVVQVLAGIPLRYVAQTLGIAESLLGKWKRQYEQQGDDAFPGNGKQRGESAELRRLRQQLAHVLINRLPGTPRPIGLETRPLHCPRWTAVVGFWEAPSPSKS
ncbi:transposase [Pseudomonas sp. QL9]|uniref:transposase n=1 Tax=Pseudomonas sp. QL9 TaxID=3242725 RepID=UPI00352A34F8